MHQTPDRTRRARRLRAKVTHAESQLWDLLRGRKLENLKFRRQAPVAGFVVDFFCAELKLVIELDGGIHDLRTEVDSLRDERLIAAGFKVMRFSNGAFQSNPAVVLDAIRSQTAHVRT
ncbi:endonuclease domain-containing protein [Brevundimonas sp.]|uniref:endonuclease domain-containing protein n=1 Tax=Brevundimonas sp. TaxID=1871086 RepID=UPI0035B0DAB0